MIHENMLLLWMNELDTFMQPNIRLINPISKWFTSNWRFTADELLTWVEQSQDLMLRSTVSFLIVTYSYPFLSFWSFQVLIFLAQFYSSSFTLLHAGYLFVTDTLSTPTITEPPSVEFQDLLIPTRSNVCVARIDLGLKSHPNDWAMSLRGLRTDQQKSCFLLSPTVPPQ